MTDCWNQKKCAELILEVEKCRKDFLGYFIYLISVEIPELERLRFCENFVL